MRTVTFSTSDEVQIVASLWEGQQEKPGILLLHMMPATKESWTTLAEVLVGQGHTCLAIDLRGHGESTKTNSSAILEYGKFTDGDHQKYRNDAEAALKFMAGLGVHKSAIVGASIGANVAVVLGAARDEVCAVAALSPGLSYHGVTLETAMQQWTAKKPLFLAASTDDAYAFESVAAIARGIPTATVVTCERAGHGTTMLERDTACGQQLIQWLTERI